MNNLNSEVKPVTAARPANRLLWACMILSAAAILTTPTAKAHEVSRQHYIYADHPIAYRPTAFPGWVHRDKEFRNWYYVSGYSQLRYLSWHRLHDLYQLDRHYHRKYGRYPSARVTRSYDRDNARHSVKDRHHKKSHRRHNRRDH